MVQVARVLVEFAGVRERVPASLFVHIFPVGHDFINASCLGSTCVTSQFALCYFSVAEMTLVSIFAVGLWSEKFGARFIALVLSQNVLPH